MFCSGFGGYGFGPVSSTGYGLILLTMGFRLLVFIGLIVLGIKLFKHYSNRSNETMKIINEKFARGEISEEEYLRRRTILSQKN